MESGHNAVVQRLRALLGADRVRTDAATLAQRALDTWPLLLVQSAVGAPPPPPLCVVQPRIAAEVAAALACLHHEGVAVVPYGGGSGVAGGAAPPPDTVVLDVGALDRILALDEENLTVTAEAGLVLGRLEAWLDDRGYTTGHYPQSIERAQLGGLVATRSAGQFSTRYGNIEDLLLGLEAVLPDGQAVRIGTVPRRAAGPDLRHLWLGSEGAFGVITAVTLRIFPRPPERWRGAYAVPDMRQGLSIAQRIMREGWRPAVVWLHDAVEAERHWPGAAGAGEAVLLLLSEGPAGYPRLEGVAVDALCRAAGARPLGPGPVEHWLEHRNDVEAFYRYTGQGILVDTIEVAALWTAAADIYAETVSGIKADVPELAVISGHASHCYPQGTNLYFTVGAVPARDPAAVGRVHQAIWDRAMAVALAHGGSICHHHGIGRLRVPWLPQELGTGYPLLQRLKAALDPGGRMNPGCLLPPPSRP